MTILVRGDLEQRYSSSFAYRAGGMKLWEFYIPDVNSRHWGFKSITAEKDQPVKKGDELGYFSYGGSTLALVFQRAAIRRFTVHQPDPGTCRPGSTINVNSKIAIGK